MLVALLSFAPLYVVGLQMLANVAGIIVFGRTYGERVPLRLLARMPFTYVPYQWLVAFSALRASIRQTRGNREWEKTEHHGAHRRPRLAPSPQPVMLTEARAALSEEALT